MLLEVHCMHSCLIGLSSASGRGCCHTPAAASAAGSLWLVLLHDLGELLHLLGSAHRQHAGLDLQPQQQQQQQYAEKNSVHRTAELVKPLCTQFSNAAACYMHGAHGATAVQEYLRPQLS
jgi:hypothetical protein